MTYRRLPPLNALRAFEAAARHLSVTRAAGELSVTPGAVSRQVRELEQHLGTTLFRRGPVGLALTPSGEALARAAREALDRLAEGVREAGSAAPPAPARLRIGAYSFFASRWLIPRWHRLRAACPELEVELTTTSHALELAPHLFDAVIAVADPRRAPLPGFSITPLLPIETQPVCAPSLLGPGFDLREQRLLHTRQRPQDWRRWLAAAGITGLDPAAGSVFESIGIALDAAAEGLGVALAIRALAAPDLAAGRSALAHPFARRSARGFVLMQAEQPDGAEGSPALAAFTRWLLAEAKAAED